ncbi:hypothetical protein AX27061_2343 [Achromobacter xylosoxidans NBRC 15126 = ATCC 27061]|nr:hypothetical protein AX27061_2343 [Achromobacter xylosoxidans NBRC 15126 = ATCC 27061]CCH08108.1 hypothetical protein NH44784_041651 [Achromobacter xylosoxidans NH44784-1996]
MRSKVAAGWPVAERADAGVSWRARCSRIAPPGRRWRAVWL